MDSLETVLMFLIEKHDPYAPDDSGDERWEVGTVEGLEARLDDLTSIGGDTVLSDFGEDCERCGGYGKARAHRGESQPRNYVCPNCQGTGKAMNFWRWTDPETGIEVTARRA